MSFSAFEKSISLGKPEKLTEEHDVGEFSCGVSSLDDYLYKTALKSQERDAVVYVVCLAGTKKVVAYYTLSNGAVSRTDAPRKISRNSPKLIPVTILGRLAVDEQYSGYGIGAGLLKDAVINCVKASKIVASKAILVHALDESVADFYIKYGFCGFPSHPLTLFVSLST